MSDPTSASTIGQSTKVNGTNAANTTTGTATADKVDAKAGNDTGVGGAGDDWVKGGSGDDNVDGGAGSDRVDGGAGNDRLIYKVGENTGATDTYDGGAGTNRLVLQMTRAEWMRDDIQADVAAFLVYLATASTGTNSSKGFTFSAFKLTVTKVSALDVVVDGVQLDPRDEAITAVADTWLAATEHSSIAGNVTANDVVPDLVRAVDVVQGPAKGTLALNTDGSFVYNPGNDFNSLAEGETAQATFTYKVTDADRDSTTAQVTLTITGTNDAPIANADTGTTNENDSIAVNVLANDTDVDTSDTHTVKAATITSGLGAVAVTNNQVQWTPGTTYDYLAVGETATVGISYTQSDNHGAQATSALTLTVKGTNDVPVAKADTAVTDENAGITVNVLGNDTDLDASDTHTVKTASLTTGLGSVAVTNNQVQWTPGTAYDSLALGETATVAIAYTQSDNNNATADSTLTLTVNGRNDAPTVAAALTSKASEEAAPYTINLLAGAADVDHAASLKVAGFAEAGTKGGWTLTGNVLSINPDHFDALSTGDTEKLSFNYQVVDEQGAAVNQSLALAIEGFTDVPSLAVVASAGSRVNKVNLTITSQPANNERVVLSFGTLPANTVVLNAAGQNVSAGLNSFIGTQVFTVVLPDGVDTNADLTISVTGMDDVKQKAIGSTSGVIDLVFDHSRTTDQVVFGSEDQGIWASGPAPMVQWHEYIPLIGGVTKTWENGQWQDTGTGTWNSGDFTLVSADITAAEVKALALKIPQDILDTARNVFNTTAYAVDQTIQNTWNTAKSTFTGAVNEANRLFNEAVSWADQVFNNTINAGVQAAYDTANAVHKAAIDVAVWVRDTNISAWSWLGQWVSDAAWTVYNESKRIADDALTFALDAVNQTADGLRQIAQHVKNDAVAAATWVKDTTLAGAQWTFDTAEKVYNDAKKAVFDAAKTIFDGAQKVFDDTSHALDAIQGQTKLEVKGDLHATVGVQVDFVLDSGSVDTEVKYELGSTLQHNRTTDVLVITPQLINQTTGAKVAFETISPNAVLKAVLLYDVGVDLDVFLDSNLYVNGTTVWDISPGEGIKIGTSVATDGFQSDFDFAKLKEAGAALLNGITVGEVVLVDFDSTTLEQIEVPFIESLTYGIVTAEVGFPTVGTEGTAEGYRGNYFAEGSLIAVDLSEITSTLSNMVNAKLDFSPELRQNLSLPSLQGKSIAQAVDLLAQAFLGTVLDVLDGQAASTPIFVIDATDKRPGSLIHANFVPDSVIGSTLTPDTATFGFYTAYGESNDVVKVSVDVDQLVAVIVNKVAEAVAAAVSSGATVQVLEAIPDINPLDLAFGLEEILQVIKAPKETADQIKKYFDLAVGFEAADINVNSSLRFSQDFTLSIDDVDYLVTLEDGTEFNFAANAQGSLTINNASSHDADNNGTVEYSMKLVPSAMFSNDTELKLQLGYVLDFLQASLAADLKIPLDDLLTIKIPGLPDITLNLVDLELGPLLRVTGDLDLASADVFEARFAIDVGSDEVDGTFTATDETIVTVIGTPEVVV